MLARFLALLASGEIGFLKRRVKTAVIGYGAAALAALAGAVFLVYAGFLGTAEQVGPTVAALYFGVGFVLLAVAIIVVFKIVAAMQRRAQRRRLAADRSAMAGASAMAMLPVLISRKGGMSVALVALAGLAGFAAYRAMQNPDDDHDD